MCLAIVAVILLFIESREKVVLLSGKEVSAVRLNPLRVASFTAVNAATLSTEGTCGRPQPAPEE